MPFKRNFEECNVYDKWQEGDVTWTVEDVDPKDDELVSKLYLEYFIPDETFCKRFEVSTDEGAKQGMKSFWLKMLEVRTSLACYRHYEGSREIAAANICAVKSIDDPPEDYTGAGESLMTVINTVEYIDKEADVYNKLGLDTYLSGAGLLVVPKYRGAKLGARVLKAREPMCKLLGIKGTSTLFSGIASQKSAARVGFETICDVSFGELAAAGLVFPGDPEPRVKLMMKKYY